MGYLTDLLNRLRTSLPDRHEWEATVDYLVGTQLEAGGWSGRGDQLDVYWTSFALRTLYVLGVADETTWRCAVEFLFGTLVGHGSSVDRASALTSLVLADRLGLLTHRERHRLWREGRQYLNQLEGLRTADGGYNRSAGARFGSTYQTFIAFVAYAEADRHLPAIDKVVRFLRGRRLPDGGYGETRISRRAGTNPTAAAVAVLTQLGELTEGERAETARFLLGMRGPEGGFRANSRIPFSDLLSTFTAMNALWELDVCPTEEQLDRIEAYTRSLLDPGGGFRAALWDSEVDPEYTFYGVGTLALIRQFRRSAHGDRANTGTA